MTTIKTFWVFSLTAVSLSFSFYYHSQDECKWLFYILSAILILLSSDNFLNIPISFLALQSFLLMCLLKLSFIKCYSTMLLWQCVVNNVIIKDKIWVINHVRYFEKTFWRKVFWRKKFSSLFLKTFSIKTPSY